MITNGAGTIKRLAMVVSGYISLGSAVIAHAESGRIPIFKPIVITESGSYVVTRDFNVTTGNAIAISNNASVTIDFAGHTINAAGGAASVIDVHNNGQFAGPCPQLRLLGGRIAGPPGAIASGVYFSHAHMSCMSHAEFSHMTFENASVLIRDARTAISSSHFSRSNLQIESDDGALPVRVEGNVFSQSHLNVIAGSSAQIRNNVFDHGSIGVWPSSVGYGGNTTQVEANAISYGNLTIGVSTSRVANEVVVSRNSLFRGVVSVKAVNGARVNENSVSGCGSSIGGINIVESQQVLLEGNQISGCLSGLAFDGASSTNTYRNNVLRGNGTPVDDQGTDNINAGGNIP